MSRIQLALNVSDLDEAIAFYSRMFDAAPAKVRPNYANFAIADPPLKLVLMQTGAPGATLNHLGVEVESVDAVRGATSRLTDEGMTTRAEQGACCYAEQDKVWVSDPDGAPWEFYTVLGDAPQASIGCDDHACATGSCC
jgi:catechol 2,3-dioxygenase-like lactoylglutathione lyase family enzyme